MELADCLPLADRTAGDLPYSHQRHVELARALAAEPRFLLLDEPAAGMTESEADRLGDVIRAVAKLGIGVLVVDHNVPWICAICDVVSVQHLGQIISSGSPETVRRDPLVIEAYIGTRSSETEVPEHVDG
jgi:ABC-type branched-subunit amino acid transport system ATPase component